MQLWHQISQSDINKAAAGDGQHVGQDVVQLFKEQIACNATLGGDCARQRDLQNRSPVREKSRLTNALQELQDTHHIKLKSSGKSKLIYLNPALLKGDDR